MTVALRSQAPVLWLCCALLLSFIPLQGIEPSPTLPRQHRTALNALGRTPLFFTENRGQVPREVRYYLKAPEGAVYFTRDTIVYDLVSMARPGPEGDAPPSLQRHAVTMQPVGASPTVQISASSPLRGKVNHFTGNDPARWRTGVPTYGAIAYQDLYPGIDLKVYGADDRMEYDFVVHPGADPGAIRFALQGIDGLRLDPAGDLVIETPLAELRHRKPVVYQKIGRQRRAVDSAFWVEGSGFGFVLGDYDPIHVLIIDPVTLAYNTFLGGGGSESGSSIDVDGQGNAYVTGYTASLNFPTEGAHQGTHQGGQIDAFVSKFDPSGQLIYSTYLGGDGWDEARAIAVHGQTAYITGITSSSNYPTINAYQGTHQGGGDAFVTRLDTDGDALIYSTYVGGEGYDIASAIAVDAEANAYITGRTESASFPYKNGYWATLRGYGDAFVTKLYPEPVLGSRLCYSTYLGGTAYDDHGRGIDVDEHGNAYVTGWTTSTDFPTTFTAYQGHHGGGNYDAFVTKLWPGGGNQLAYSTFLGGDADDEAADIAVRYLIEYSDSEGALGVVSVVGDTESANFPTQAPYQAQYNGGDGDAFVTVLDLSDNSLRYSTYLGGSGYDGASSVALAPPGIAYVSGGTGSTDFPTENAFQGNLGGIAGTDWDAFVTKLGIDGTILPLSANFSTYLGGWGFDSGAGIAVDGLGNTYVAGNTESTNFPVRNAYQPRPGGFGDAYAAKLVVISEAELEEDFDDGQAQGWSDDGSGTWSLQPETTTAANGVYLMAGDGGAAGRYTHFVQDLSDFTCQADVRKLAGDSTSAYGYGLYFRSDGMQQSYYEFIIVVDGYYKVGKSLYGEYESLVPWTSSPAINTGYNTWNTLKVVAKGNTFTFYANDTLLTTFEETAGQPSRGAATVVSDDFPLPQGKIGLFAIDAADSLEPDAVEFDNVVVQDLLRHRVYLPITVRNCAGGPPSGWMTLVNETFEGAFPNAWDIYDGSAGGGEYVWGRRGCLPYEGNNNGWAVGGGADGLVLGCGNHYPDDVSSWMIYGPFSLADANAADLKFKLWRDTEDTVGPQDYLFYGASTDGTNFTGWRNDGSSGGWVSKTLNLANVDGQGLDLTGEPQVWVALRFKSDDNGITRPHGAHVDNVVVRKHVPPAVSSGVPAAPPGPSGESGSGGDVPAREVLDR